MANFRRNHPRKQPCSVMSTSHRCFEPKADRTANRDELRNSLEEYAHVAAPDPWGDDVSFYLWDRDPAFNLSFFDDCCC